MKEIVLGALICEKIKQIYFKDQSWQASYQQVAGKYGIFKKIMSKIYPECTVIDILEDVQHFNLSDIEEIFSIQDDYLQEEKVLTPKTKYGNDVIWVPIPLDQPEMMNKVRQFLQNCSI